MKIKCSIINFNFNFYNLLSNYRDSLSLAILLIYIMNCSLAPPTSFPQFRKLDSYNREKSSGNVFFVEFADWVKMSIEELDDQDIVEIIGIKEFQHLTGGDRGPTFQNNRRQINAPPTTQIFNGLEDIEIAEIFFTNVMKEIWSIIPKGRATGYLGPTVDKSLLSFESFNVIPFR